MASPPVTRRLRLAARDAGRVPRLYRWPVAGVASWISSRQASFDIMVAAIVAFTALWQPFNVRVGPRVRLIGLGMAVALLGRRRYPLVVMALVSLGGLLQVLLYSPWHDPQLYDIAVLIAMYSVVKYGRRLWHGLLAAVPVVIGCGIELERHINAAPDLPRLARLWVEESAFLMAVCVAVWLSAYTVRTRRLYVAGLEERAATAERERDHLARIAVATERASIARELHDVVAHSMAVMIVQADGATYTLDADPDRAKAAIKQVASTGRDALEDMRRLVGVLRGGDEETDPAADRRRVGLDQLGALVDRARSAGLRVTLTESGERPELPPSAELTVYRIVQEALTNVLRHAGLSAAVDLALRYRPDAVLIDVDDDGGAAATGHDSGDGSGRHGSEGGSGGYGSDGGSGRYGEGHGLVGMRERVAVHGGTFEAGPKLSGGWRVHAEVPWT
ncbi:sensor histidine kinase [Rugosimonospora africana]|uniref:histidine kinase n=1 Tax=Rugosimonospora africana TaxID=556532 RepID=A0A8J3VU16_9ACTN|nr:sensor histidine kinase [Rugosimonospora africana]GIH18148.1 two-component sensor histidine kinase [Rugosimonospora africana]